MGETKYPKLPGIAEVVLDLETQVVVIHELRGSEVKNGAEEDNMTALAIRKMDFDDDQDIEPVGMTCVMGLDLPSRAISFTLISTRIAVKRRCKAANSRVSVRSAADAFIQQSPLELKRFAARLSVRMIQ